MSDRVAMNKYGYAILGLGGFCISLGLFFMVMFKINRYA